MMVQYTVPPVVASNGYVLTVAGVQCVSNFTEFLDVVLRKLV